MPTTVITPARAAVPFLVAMMLISGVTNTLLTKYQDQKCLRHCDDPDLSRREHFEQPVIQTAQMFLGEMACWLVVGVMKLYNRFIQHSKSPSQHGYHVVGDSNFTDEANETNETNENEADTYTNSYSPLNGGVATEGHKAEFLAGWRICLLALPALCDIVGTTMMNGGLLLVAASIYQMTRGALVLFVGVFSVLFLHRRLHMFQWIALTGVVIGVAIVGLAGALEPVPDNAPTNLISSGSYTYPTGVLQTIIGVFLIAFAQLFTASQFVLEEWIFEQSNIEPLNAVGWEGIFGFTLMLIGMFLSKSIIDRNDGGRHGYFDLAYGWKQIVENPSIYYSSILIMISIGCFNYFGLSVTRSVSATSRSTIDTCRTLFIWIFSLGLGWESFKWLQIVGFGLLVYSTFLYNGLVQPPMSWMQVNEVEELLPEDVIEHS